MDITKVRQWAVITFLGLMALGLSNCSDSPQEQLKLTQDGVVAASLLKNGQMAPISSINQGTVIRRLPNKKFVSTLGDSAKIQNSLTFSTITFNSSGTRLFSSNQNTITPLANRKWQIYQSV